MLAGGSGRDVSASETVLPATSKRIPPKRFEVASVKLFQVTKAQYQKETTKRSSVTKARRDGLHDDAPAVVPRRRALSQHCSVNGFESKGHFQEDASSIQIHSYSNPALPIRTDQDGVPLASIDCSDIAPARGLCNIGNTCYQNAIVQALYFNSGLRKYLALQHSCACESDSEQNVNRCGKVTRTLCELINDMLSGSNTFISQHKFKSMVDSHMAQFHGRRQHDAQEFLLSLLDNLQEEAIPLPAIEVSNLATHHKDLILCPYTCVQGDPLPCMHVRIHYLI